MGRSESDTGHPEWVHAGAVAGLLGRCNTCEWVEIDALPNEVRVRLLPFPLVFTDLPDGRVRITGLPPWLIYRFLHRLGVHWVQRRSRCYAAPCTCTI